MPTRVIGAGGLGGLIGGVVMGMWSMVILWLTGVGFWAPLNLIAHTFWRGAPLGAGFSWRALVIGLVAHMVVSVLLGLLFAALAGLAPARMVSQAMLPLWGVLYGLVVLLVNHYGIWPAIDEAAAEAFTPWVFAVGHALYGQVVGWTLAMMAPRRPAATPR